MTSVDTLKQKLTDLAVNPNNIQRAVYEMLDEITDGDMQITDPTSPFVDLMVTSSILTDAAINSSIVNTRRRYPALAQTEDELFLHMSDNDFLGIYATCARDKFSLMFSRAELLSKLVEDPDTGIRKLVIPRNTKIKVADLVFSLQYPIEIRQMLHGGLSVVYDVSKTSPLQTISNNVVEWQYSEDRSDIYLWLTFDMFQFDVTSAQSSVSASNQFKMEMSYSNKYLYARVYHLNLDGTWSELRTTHTEQVFDVSTPTAVLRVNQNKKVLTVTLPQIFTTTGLLSRKIRVDLYTTNGAISIDLANYGFDSFVAEWVTIDDNDSSVYTDPLSSLTKVVAFSQANVNGGTDPITFEKLRERVINNSVGDINIPITNSNLQAAIESEFDIVKNVDVLTNRIFLATKDIPAPSDLSTSSGIGATISPVRETISSMSNLHGAVINNDRATIKSMSLFKRINGVVTHCTSAEYDRVNGLPVDEKALEITGNQYLFNPYYYVLDASSLEFDLRTYDLDRPSVVSKVFVQENDTTLLQVSSQEYWVEQTSTGYRLVVKTSSDEGFRQLDDQDIVVQLSYIPSGENSRAYLNGYLIEKDDTDERYYGFDLDTNYDLDKEHNIQLTKFKMFDTSDKILPCSLTTDFDIFYTTTSSVGNQFANSEIDSKLGMFLLETGVVGVAHERLTIRLGYNLDNLWKRSRTITTEKIYETYALDVAAYYTKNIYEINPETGGIVFIVNGVPETRLLHAEGDPILDISGNPVILHHKGDVILDANQNPIEVASRKLAREVEILMLDGAYLFATTQSVASYVNSTISNLTDWIMDGLQDIEDRLLEKTSIFFYPKVRLGNIAATIDGGGLTVVRADQSFTVTLTISEAVSKDNALKDILAIRTREVIVYSLARQTFSITEIENNLKTVYGDNVIDVTVRGLAGSDTARVVTLQSASDQCTIAKKLVALSSGQLTIEDNITINFVRHKPTVNS